MDAGRAATPTWLRVVEGVALTKIAVALLGSSAAIGAMPAFTAVNFLLHVTLFAGAGVVLRTMGANDPRAQPLGLFFILVATAWSDRLLVAVGAGAPTLQPFCSLLQHLQVIAFSPYLFWMFVRDFPRRLAFYPSRVVPVAMAAALVLGWALFLANASRFVWMTGAVADVASWFDRGRLDRLFWPVVFNLSFPAIAYAAWQGRRAAYDERLRVKIMLFGLILGLVPEIALTLVAAVVPELRSYATTPRGRIVIGTVISLPELTIPFTVAYAVLVHRALDVRLIVRKVLQYALARSTLLVLTTIPFLVLAATLYLHRDEPLARVFSGVTGFVLLAAIATGLTAVTQRPRLLSALDRRFFREQYDAHAILSALVQNTRRLHDPMELAAVVPIEIDRALHVESAAVFILDQASQKFVAVQQAVRPLASSSRIVSFLSDSMDGIFDVDWSRPGARLPDIPEDEQQWLAESQARLLVAVRDHTGAVTAAIALGERRSGLVFSGEDRMLLRTIADAVGLALERQTVAANATLASHEADTAAHECDVCGLVCADTGSKCVRCGGTLVRSRLPLLLAGKYRPLERVGKGGMGVVYRASDVALARDVALKTLPRMSAAHAPRMRREARAMAAVSHPNLAAIYSAETWRGSPALVVEFLHGGTLADRLTQSGSLPVMTALELACTLADALACLHQAGLLHRDIKPSNIGFTADGSPKLLDFGLARVLERGDGAIPPLVVESDAPSDIEDHKLTKTGDVVGTVPYLSPEGIVGAAPSVAFDLWALSMVLYESIAGQHPFLPATLPSLLYNISKAAVPDIRDYAPNTPANVADFFRQCLHANADERPQTARAWRAHASSLLDTRVSAAS